MSKKNKKEPKKEPKIFSTKSISGINEEVDRDIKNSLNHIYRDKGGRTMDISKLDSNTNRGSLYYFNRIFLFGVVVVGLYFGIQYIRSTYFNQSKGEVTLSWDAPAAVTSGEELELDILYHNTLDVPLTDIELSIRPPENFVLSDTNPQSSDEDGRVWKISRIEPNREGKITLRGKLYGQIGDSFTFQGILSYQQLNFSSTFEEHASWLVQIAASRLISEKSFPAQAGVDEEVEYKIKLFTSEFMSDDLSVKVIPHFPDSFELMSQEKSFIEEEQAWILTGLTTPEDAPPNEDAVPQVNFKGKFITDDEPEQTITLEYFVKAADDNYYLEKQDELITQLVQGEFILSLILNGESSVHAVNLGETLNYTLTYKNQSASSARDIVLLLEWPSGFMDYDSLISIPSGKREDDNLVWTKDEIEELGDLSSGSGGTIDITVNLNEALALDEAPALFTSMAKATIAFFNDVEADINIKSNEIESPINSDLEWRSSARYYNDDDIPVGTGPMPPQVGKTTTLHIFWRIINSSHTVTSLKVKGNLPINVNWTGRNNVTAGSLEYNELTRAVTWTIDTLEKGEGEVVADFEISITPTFDDVNKIMLLMPSAILTALDEDTDGEISIDSKALTTDLDDDPVLSGRGLVES